MKKCFLFLTILLFASISHGQSIYADPESDKYYPENKFIRDKKIKFILDSSVYSKPIEQRAEAYDKLGRLIGNFYYEIAKLDNPYTYVRRGDTLIRLSHVQQEDKLYSYERFIYNKKGQILNYLQCVSDYLGKGTFTVYYDEFYYGDESVLQSKLSYYKSEYPGIISEQHTIKRADLDLIDIIYYSQKRLANGNKLVIGKHSLGKPNWRATDTTTFDSKNRLIKFNTFAKTAAMGCPVGNNVNYIIEYKYTDSSLVTTQYTTYCKLTLQDFTCLESTMSDKYVNIIIFDKDHLKRKRFHAFNDGEKKLSGKYDYVYYE